MKYFNILIKAIFAGIMISMGGIIYLSLANKIVGSMLFSLGLLTVCMYEMNLYTGKIGYLLINKADYLIELLITLIGNFIGTYLVAFLIRHSRLSNLVSVAKSIIEIRLNDSLISIFILSIFCGIIMYLAVNNYKKSHHEIGKYLVIIMGIMVFILSGFEHCVANMFYFNMANVMNSKVLLYLLIMIFGNSLGSLLIAFYELKIKKSDFD